VQVKVAVCRSRLREGLLHDRTKGGRIIGRNHDSETVETGSVTFHKARSYHPRQSGGDLVWIAGRVKDVHQELPTDVDPREPSVLFLSRGRVGEFDLPQNLIRTTTSEGGADEGSKSGGLVDGHHFILSRSRGYRVQGTGHRAQGTGRI
jgi:hypothetical protein